MVETGIHTAPLWSGKVSINFPWKKGLLRKGAENKRYGLVQPFFVSYLYGQLAKQVKRLNQTISIYELARFDWTVFFNIFELL